MKELEASNIKSTWGLIIFVNFLLDNLVHPKMNIMGFIWNGGSSYICFYLFEKRQINIRIFNLAHGNDDLLSQK